MTNVARLPGPVADVWDWQRLGLCRGRDSAQFFHPDGERGASRGRREAAAKALCRTCPVRAQCAAHALNTREPYGVWGGFTETERLRLMATGWEDLVGRPAHRGGRLLPRGPAPCVTGPRLRPRPTDSRVSRHPDDSNRGNLDGHLPAGGGGKDRQAR